MMSASNWLTLVVSLVALLSVVMSYRMGKKQIANAHDLALISTNHAPMTARDSGGNCFPLVAFRAMPSELCLITRRTAPTNTHRHGPRLSVSDL
jgi:hypothetical protein